jgi:riboflavin kinase / FMN adenylyltransferase
MSISGRMRFAAMTEPRAVALGAFDGVHLGHRRVIETAKAEGLPTTVTTFDPHPRIALGHHVELLTTLDRRIELLSELGVETVVVRFTQDLALATPEQFADLILKPLGARVVVAGEDFRFGRGRSGDLDTLARLGFETRPVPLRDDISSSRIRQLLREGDVEDAARLLGRPHEVEGTVVSGDARGGTLGFPTANLAVPAEVIVPAYGIYAGQVGENRAAVSIGVNPHYGGQERRIEAFLLDFDGNLYGEHLFVELWKRLRDEQAFASEQELIDQIGRDVEETRRAEPPV